MDTITLDINKDIEFCRCGNMPVLITKLTDNECKLHCNCGIETAFRSSEKEAIEDWNSKIFM